MASPVSARPSETVVHPLQPVYDQGSRVLLLGTLPSPLSREAGDPYRNPRNRFWAVMAALWGEDVPTSIEARRDLCRRRHIALDDVLQSCRIAGASDASIADPVPKDLRPILDAAPIQQIFCTGTTAARLYRRLIEPELGRPCICLPSTSPANARMRLDDLIVAYAPVRTVADGGGAQ